MAGAPQVAAPAELVHDLNNALGSVLQLAHLARGGCEDGTQVAADLDLLVREVERAAAVVAEIRVDAPLAHAATVLVIEDDATMRGLVERTLSADGHRVLAAASVAEALALASASPPIDLVLADLGVPGLSGEAVPAALAGSGAPPVVAMSGSASLPADADGVLAKPFTPDELTATVRGSLAG